MSASVRVTTTTAINMSGPVTVDRLRDVLEGLPGNGTVRITNTTGGQMDPTVTTITVTH